MFQIIVPIFNEEKTLEQVLLYAKKNEYLKNIVFVDDASTDSSPQILGKWAKNEGIRAISLSNNLKKEGAIRAVLEILAKEGDLASFTVLLDSDTFINLPETGEVVDSQIEKAIAHMEACELSALAFQINAISDAKKNIFSYGAFADYAAMQFDQWLVGKQQMLWVINGPGGIFQTKHLLQILKSIVPDFETGDLLITVELMKQKLAIEFYPDISVSTFVPTTLKEYFNQRRRWERGTTKVLWNERKFYFFLFGQLSLLAVSTLIHLSLYIGLLASLVMVVSDVMSTNDFFNAIVVAISIWFIVSILKGLWLRRRRAHFPFFRYCLCAIGNGVLWAFITTPARITGFSEGIVQIFLVSNRAAISPNSHIEDFFWFSTDQEIILIKSRVNV